MQSDIVHIVKLFVGIAMLLGCFHFMLIPTLHEGFRQKIFFLRRQLFLLIVKDRISPTDPAYTRLRSTMNGLLRFAERLSLGRLFLHGVIFRDETKNYIDTMNLRLEEVQDVQTKNELMALRKKVGYEIIRHIFFTSPLLWLFGLITLPFTAPVILVWALVKGIQAMDIKMKILLYQYLPIDGIQAQAEALVMLPK